MLNDCKDNFNDCSRYQPQFVCSHRSHSGDVPGNENAFRLNDFKANSYLVFLVVGIKPRPTDSSYDSLCIHQIDKGVLSEMLCAN
jgi:hypothetical protein